MEINTFNQKINTHDIINALKREIQIHGSDITSGINKNMETFKTLKLIWKTQGTATKGQIAKDTS